MKNWFNYKDTISGKTYLYRSLIVGIPLSIIYFLLEEVNYYAGSLFGISMYIIFFSFRYKFSIIVARRLYRQIGRKILQKGTKNWQKLFREK